MLRQWEELPNFMQTPEVRPYWEALNKKRGQLVVKRVFDFIMGIVLLIILAIPMVIIAIMIKIEDSGSVLYRQERVTIYGRHFKIHKFRTMIIDADKIGSIVTIKNDNRITKIGSKLRKFRLDELPQIFDVISGNMSFVGTRPEAVKYVTQYQPEFNATLLMLAGITSETSIRYKNEDEILGEAENIDEMYVKQVLPEKMKWNLKNIKKFSFMSDIKVMLKTVFVILREEYKYKDNY